MYLAGMDIGGTKICVFLSDDKGNILSDQKFPTHPNEHWKLDAETISNSLESMLKEKGLKKTDLIGIGISAPGPLSTRTGSLLTPPNLPGWKNAALVSFFLERFPCPIILNNDANAAALAEYEFGPFKKTKNLVYLTCSTGMGGGAIVNGELCQGESDTALEVGHMVIDPRGPRCPCGLKGCFEMYCGGRALAMRIQHQLQKESIQTLILEKANGNLHEITATHLIDAVKEKDPYALKIWSQYIEKLAHGIGTIIMHLNPKVVILGTMAVHAQELLLAPLRKEIVRFAWKEPLEVCQIVASSLKNLSALSALALAKQGAKKS